MNNDAILVSKVKSKYHLYAATFNFSPEKVEVCRRIKESQGWEAFSYEAEKKQWVFSDLSIISLLEKYFLVEMDIETSIDRSFHLKEVQISKPQNSNELLTECRREVEAMDNGSITLRPYQVDALTNILYSIRAELPGNDLAVVPTGGGKSLLIASIARLLNEDVLIIQPGKEILSQNLEKLTRYIDRSEIGVYSAAMQEKTIKRFTFATIGSIFRRANFFKHFKYVIVDEAHCLSPKDSNTMFQKFLSVVQPKKVLGFTATPFRQDNSYFKDKSGELISYTTVKLINRMGNPQFWKRILFNMNIGDLINQGYLCPLEYMGQSIFKHEDLRLNISKSDFDLEYFQRVSLQHEPEILKVVNHAASISKHVLVFCASVAEARSFSEKTPGSAYVSAKTDKKERERIVNDFKNGKIKIVFNVSVLGIGFDFPSLDAIVMARPTKSITVLVQFLGRGVRIAPGKTSCKVFDLTSNVQSIGRIETVKLACTNGKWDLESEKCANWHNKILYENTDFLRKKPSLDKLF